MYHVEDIYITADNNDCRKEDELLWGQVILENNTYLLLNRTQRAKVDIACIFSCIPYMKT